MKLTLNRKFKGQTYTIGDLSIDGKFFCNTIEDAVRELPATCPDTPRGRSCTCKEKVYAKTAIPAGTYKVTLQYSPRYKKKMPYLHDVPHFLGILIHSGNTEVDSAGCIILSCADEQDCNRGNFYYLDVYRSGLIKDYRLS